MFCSVIIKLLHGFHSDKNDNSQLCVSYKMKQVLVQHLPYVQ